MKMKMSWLVLVSEVHHELLMEPLQENKELCLLLHRKYQQSSRLKWQDAAERSVLVRTTRVIGPEAQRDPELLTSEKQQMEHIRQYSLSSAETDGLKKKCVWPQHIGRTTRRQHSETSKYTFISAQHGKQFPSAPLSWCLTVSMTTSLAANELHTLNSFVQLLAPVLHGVALLYVSLSFTVVGGGVSSQLSLDDW